MDALSRERYLIAPLPSIFPPPPPYLNYYQQFPPHPPHNNNHLEQLSIIRLENHHVEDDDDYDSDGYGDIYIMMKCVFLCHKKIIIFPFRAERRRRKVRC